MIENIFSDFFVITGTDFVWVALVWFFFHAFFSAFFDRLR